MQFHFTDLHNCTVFIDPFQFVYCKTRMFRGNFVSEILAVMAKSENVSPPILYAELNESWYKNGEPE